MPSKGARLFLRKRKGRNPTFVIKDAGTAISTGTPDRRKAEIQLAQYISTKNRRSGPVEAREITISDILSIYGSEHAPTVADPVRIGYAMSALLPFWGDLTADAVKGETCRRYTKIRNRAPGTIRRELNTLQAALNYCQREGYILTSPNVTMPPTPETNQRAMTRDEVAALIRAARSCKQHHIARFILVSIYTGTRKAAALNIRLAGPSMNGGWFDLEAGLLYRRCEGERITNKRRTPVRLPRQLLAHASRWQRSGSTWAVEWLGQRNADLKTAWAIQGGASVADAASFFATSIEPIERKYWQLSPHFQSGALEKIEGEAGDRKFRQSRFALIYWCTRQDSNLWPLPSEGSALSS